MPSCIFWLGGVRHGDVEATHTNCLIAEAFAFEAQCEEGEEHEGADVVGMDLTRMSKRGNASTGKNAKDVAVASVVFQYPWIHKRIMQIAVDH